MTKRELLKTKRKGNERETKSKIERKYMDGEMHEQNNKLTQDTLIDWKCLLPFACKTAKTLNNQ